jgi:enoyl-CoA hydratase
MDEPELLVSQAGSLGRISLNRPKALNSLTLGMVRGIDRALADFAVDQTVAAVLLTGEGERGLCAGGDIRAIHDSGRAGTDLAATFWREEYRLNARIHHFPKPYVAVMDGLVMGGGVGLSAHGRHRIVTEETQLAMPETGIGFFPDVGASWLLSRQPGEFGTYIGLTGARMGPADVIAAGLADRHVARGRLAALIDQLAALPADAGHAEVEAVIAGLATPAAPGLSADIRAMIDRAFGADSIEDILARLDGEAGEAAAATRRTLAAKSPIASKVALRLMRLGRASASLEDCLEREFAATAAVLQSHDFYEGVRAAVIDKDRHPAWSPKSLAEVDEAMVARYVMPRSQPLFDH